MRNLSLNIIAAVVAALTTHTAGTFLLKDLDVQSYDSLRRGIKKIPQAKKGGGYEEVEKEVKNKVLNKGLRILFYSLNSRGTSYLAGVFLFKPIL